MMLLGHAKRTSLILTSLLALTLGYAAVFTDKGTTYVNTYISPYFNSYIGKDFFKPRAVDLPEIQVAQINKRSQIPPLSKDLFGIAPIAEKPLVETRLNLSLKGTFPSSNKDQGQAVIANGNKEQLLHVGEEVLRGVTLVEVFNNHVVLDRSNAREILRFPTNDTPNFVPSLEGISITETADRQTSKQEAVSDELVEMYQKQLAENPRATLSSIGLTLVNNRYQVMQDSILSEAGFKPKDEIISINGQPIKALLNNPRTISSILSVGSVRVGLLRDRKRLSLNFKLN